MLALLNFPSRHVIVVTRSEPAACRATFIWIAALLGGREGKGRLAVVVVVAFLAQLEIEEVEDGNVRLCRCFDALLRQLRPTVCKGVVLGVTLDLDLCQVRVHQLNGRPFHLLSQLDLLSGPPV